MTNEQLVLRIKAGECVADNMAQLYEQNRGMIVKLANRYKSYAEFDDLMQEGYLGLYDAVDHWEQERGAFITCLIIFVKKAMLRYIYKYGSSIRVSIPAQENVRKYEKIRQQCLKYWGREPEDWELCYFMEINQRQLDLIKSDSKRMKIGSLDQIVGEDEDVTLQDMVADQNDQYEEFLDDIKLTELKAVIWPIVDSLPIEQSVVLRKRFQDRQTLKEIGNELGVGGEHVRQIEAKGLRSIRNSPNKRILYPFMYDEEIRHKSMQGVGLAAFNRSWTSATERAVLQMEEFRERSI